MNKPLQPNIDKELFDGETDLRVQSEPLPIYGEMASDAINAITSPDKSQVVRVWDARGPSLPERGGLRIQTHVGKWTHLSFPIPTRVWVENRLEDVGSERVRRKLNSGGLLKLNFCRAYETDGVIVDRSPGADIAGDDNLAFARADDYLGSNFTPGETIGDSSYIDSPSLLVRNNQIEVSNRNFDSLERILERSDDSVLIPHITWQVRSTLREEFQFDEVTAESTNEAFGGGETFAPTVYWDKSENQDWQFGQEATYGRRLARGAYMQNELPLGWSGPIGESGFSSVTGQPLYTHWRPGLQGKHLEVVNFPSGQGVGFQPLTSEPVLPDPAEGLPRENQTPGLFFVEADGIELLQGDTVVTGARNRTLVEPPVPSLDQSNVDLSLALTKQEQAVVYPFRVWETSAMHLFYVQLFWSWEE